MSRYQYSQRNTNRPYAHIKLPLVIVAIFLVVGFIWMWSQRADDDSDESPVVSEQVVDSDDMAEPDLAPALPNRQDELDSWVASQSGTFGVIVEDPERDEVLAAHQSDEQFFAASIYKLYVAYLGLIDIAAGQYGANEAYSGSRTRIECITLMIRDSDSPCAEKMWAEQGKAESTERLEAMGTTGTSMESLQTTAHDANVILKRLQQERDLTTEHTALLRQALLEQIYRDAIPAAVPTATVYNKVGFYETGWHDAAIVRLPSGREVVMTVYNRNAGSRQTRELTELLLAPIVAAES
jgi:beta-lactamase class A